MKTISFNTIFSKHRLLLLSLIAIVCFISCDSFVEVELPKSQLTTAVVFENYDTADAALRNIYAKMRDQGLFSGTPYGLSNELGNYADELDCYAAPGDPVLAFNINALLASNPAITDFWNLSYNQIYAANAVLDGVEDNSKLTPQQIKILKGEALFIRGLIHFYLTNLFGDIPYITSINYKINNIAGKNTKKDTYLKIITDLETARDLLQLQYSDTERTRPNRLAVSALLARVYLYNENWAQAANEASAVLNADNFYKLEGDLAKVFLKESQETIWQFSPSVAGKNTDEAGTFIFFTGPPPLVALKENLVASFDNADLRKDNWIQSITDQGMTWYHSFKYKEYENTSSSLEYSVVLRLSEQYLIRGEARAAQGDLIGAKEDLDKIRLRAGLNKTTAISQHDILQAFVQERRWELFTEFGHRFFDLKRTGVIDEILPLTKPGWDSTDGLFPIPQNELSINPNLLPQNEGY